MDISPAQFMLFSNQNDYLAYRRINADLFVWRQKVELRLAEKLLPFEGYCSVCDERVKFLATREHPCVVEGVTYPNYREHLTCSKCGYNTRMRASVDFISRLITPQAEIYLMEQKTPLYQLIKKKYRNTTGSEFLGGNLPLGSVQNAIRNEDATALTFQDNSFDVILSFDVFEHIPNYRKAFQEGFRVLKEEGYLIFSVPFIIGSDKTCVRAKIRGDGTVEHLLPPEYHGDPLQENGCLCFYHFGWDILDDLKACGFSEAKIVSFWSKENGYLGLGEQILLYAQK